MEFKLQSKFKPTGDQPRAIKQLVAGLNKGYSHQTLLGVTGSGKTFTMANVIQKVQKPTLVISHNKTLAAQLASEFQDFFPENSVNYFVSYYDYYQPEAYIPRTDTYIEKETQLNEEIDRLRHASTTALLSRDDVIIVASVSCIYGLGSPTEYKQDVLKLEKGSSLKRDIILHALVNIRYQRTQSDLWRSKFRVAGDVLEVFPAYSENNFFRIEFYGDTIEKISEVDSLTRKTLATMDAVDIYPAKHYLAPDETMKRALQQIAADLDTQVARLKKENKLLEAQRLDQRTRYDLEMIKEIGYCNGIENYSRYFDGRKPGQPPFTLIDFFPDDFLTIIDESHMSVPQIRGMYFGDRSRKETLVSFGFRLPAALDNRPLKYEEFAKKMKQTVYTSATPTDYEREMSQQVVEQIIRPTGLLDPTIEVKPTENQIDDLIAEIKARVAKKQRVLVTTLTKRMAEDLTDYLADLEIKVQYLHSEVDTMERLEILRDLRSGAYDVVVGINLLREGLDLPEVSLIAILDADKEGYLRSDTALIQTMGRAARHVEGHIIMYADKVTDSMRRAIHETNRRRTIQRGYNEEHGITPQSITKAIKETRLAGAKAAAPETAKFPLKDIPREEISHLIADLESHMEIAARNLEFEKAAAIRDQLQLLKNTSARKKRRR
ncbi:MAG: excinuclease ABC subunit UvrB [Patescibacteria group bacterium]|nr:excinuclease ABC subunit UvrB [Patescibacteria group bacterium]MDD5715873.1 excinuclease ABC subunit UvrB [Patescibacteria group bacterium]